MRPRRSRQSALAQPESSSRRCKRQHVGGGFGDRLVEPGQQRGAAVGGVSLQVVVGRDGFAAGRRTASRSRLSGSS